VGVAGGSGVGVGVTGGLVQAVTRTAIAKRKIRFFMVHILPFIGFLPVALMILAIGSSGKNRTHFA
jgi:hypothetical protein